MKSNIGGGSQRLFFLEKIIKSQVDTKRMRQNLSCVILAPPQSAVDQDFRLLMLSRNDYLTAYSRLEGIRGDT